MADWSLSKQKYGGTWKASSDGTLPPSYYPAYHIYLSTRDMARIGYLMLRKGMWNGKEVISEDWIKTTTTPFSTFKEVNPSGSGYFSYGYMWWIFDSSYYKSRPALEGEVPVVVQIVSTVSVCSSCRLVFFVTSVRGIMINAGTGCDKVKDCSLLFRF